MPVIMLTCNDTGYLLIEGHSRMTVYGLVSEKLQGSNAYIGCTKKEQMKQYDGRTFLVE